MNKSARDALSLITESEALASGLSSIDKERDAYEAIGMSLNTHGHAPASGD